MFQKRQHFMMDLPRVDGIDDGKNILSYYFSDNDRRLLSSEGEGVLEEMRLPAQAQIAQHQLPADSIYFLVTGMARVSKDDPNNEKGKEKTAPEKPTARATLRRQSLLSAAGPRCTPAGSASSTLIQSSTQLPAGWHCEFKCGFSGLYHEVARHEKTCEKRPKASRAIEIATEMSRHTADAGRGTSQLSISAAQFGGVDAEQVQPTSSPLARVVTQDTSFNIERRRIKRGGSSSYHSDPEGLARAKSAWIDYKENEIGLNEVLLGAGCCFNDIELLLQDAGFESNNFGNLTTVTEVSCYRLR